VVRSCPSPVRRVHLSLSTCCNFLRARRTGFSHGVGVTQPTRLGPFALPHPKDLKPLLASWIVLSRIVLRATYAAGTTRPLPTA
jgi:hypothetical protein